MGTLWKIALRNTIRHARRTIITAVVMMGGIAFFIFYDSLLAGMDRMAVDTMESYTLSSLKVRTPAYIKDIEASPLDKGLARPVETLAAVTAQGLQGTPRIRFVARLSNYTDEIPVLADAVDPATDPKVFKLGQAVTDGAWLSAGPPHSVVLGAGAGSGPVINPPPAPQCSGPCSWSSHNGTTGSRFAKRGLRFGSGKNRGAEPHTNGSRP